EHDGRDRHSSRRARLLSVGVGARLFHVPRLRLDRRRRSAASRRAVPAVPERDGRTELRRRPRDRPPIRDPRSRQLRRRRGLLPPFDAVETDDSTGGMVHTSAARRFVGFGFCDAIYLTGALLFPSLLRHRAAIELAEMFRDDSYHRRAAAIADHVVPIFSDRKNAGGWLLAATDVGRQPDVWGTAYALHRNILPADSAATARDTLADAVRRGTITLD